MNNLTRLPERAMELASQVGDGLRDRVPDRAIKWIETGAAIGALKTGTRIASRFVRRNPTVAVAAAAGAGLLWYAARRRAKQAENDALEGTATRVEAKRAGGNGSRRTRTSSTRRGSKSQSTSASPNAES
ncbi:MAG: hypothetical protein JWL98_181 [Xanthomonadaceae bacterium]|nr:hypothetical protein [Xanthomonadaceae bacterium]